MRSMNSYQKFFYRSFWVFLWTCLAALLVALLTGVFFPFGTSLRFIGGVGYVGFYGALCAAILCLILLTQNRPLHDRSLFVMALSIMGVMLLALASMYVAWLYGAAALFGIVTVSPVYAGLSTLVKVGIILSLTLMHAAYVISCRPLHKIHIISTLFAILWGILTGWSFIGGYLHGPSSYPLAVMLNGAGAAVTALMLVKQQQQKPASLQRKP